MIHPRNLLFHHRPPAAIRGVATAVLILVCAVIARRNQSADTELAVRRQDRDPQSPTLLLDVVDQATGRWTPARFSLTVNGAPHDPETLGRHGLRFLSVHESKRQEYVVTYARGTGPVNIPLPPAARTVAVHVAKGFEHLPATEQRNLSGKSVSITVSLQRWTDLEAKGWTAADEHVHYDRFNPAGDADWLTMLAGDGLAQAHFLVLKGGKVPGVWARQYAYGKDGEASDGQRLIRSGEEYRDSAQGHINLLGLSEVIQPISTGGLGSPPVHVNYPPLRDVFERNRELGGLGGVAHGGSLGRQPTAIVDTVLGAVDFFEIGNAHLYSLDLWYRLMNCGYDLPPAAGTDLPNYPFRDRWQPFLGSMRMYVKTDGRRDFASWKQAVQSGAVFITSGPLMEFRVNDVGPGGVVHLPDRGGEVVIEAEIASPVGPTSLEIIRNGSTVPVQLDNRHVDGVQRRRTRVRLPVRESCWLAARGRGVPLESLKDAVTRDRQPEWINTDAVAHTGTVRVLVGEQPIRSADDATILVRMMRQQQQHYATQGRYEQAAHRLRVLGLFDQAIAALESRHAE